MTQPSRWGIARIVAAFGAALVLGAGGLLAQGTTGKVEGTIKDQSGAPVAGAQVIIVGSAFATTSNEQGYYFINNVPAGVVTVRAQYIGYAPAETRNVRVFAGQTMTINMALEQRAIEVGGITVTVEQNPIVPRDQTASKPTLAGELVQNLPVDALSQVLRLQPGVVESARGISIRGGRTNDAIVYIDGVPVRSVTGNVTTASVGTNAVEEASVTTGAIGATQGDAQSGVISYVTRSGGQHYTGFLSYATDNFSEKSGQGLNRVEASLGGPIRGNLTFFLSTTMQGQQNGAYGIGADQFPVYVLNGIDTTVTVPTSGAAGTDSTRIALPAFTRYSSGYRRPDSWSSSWNIDSKVQYSYGTGSRISATYHRTRGQGLNYRGTGALYNPMQQTGFLNMSNALIVNWTQNLARSSERMLALDAYLSYQWDRTTGGPVDQSWFADNHTPFGWFGFNNVQFVVDQNNFPIDDRLIQNLRVNNCRNGRDAARPAMGGCIPYIDRNDINTSAFYRENPYGTDRSQFSADGMGAAGINLQRENRWVGRVNLDWQADRYNRFQLGGDFVKADAGVFNSTINDQGFMDGNAYKPFRMGLFAQDRLDLGDVVIDLGLRYDRMNPDVWYSNTPGRVYTDPLRIGNLSRAYTAQDTVMGQRCAADLAAADTTAWSTCNMFKSQSRSILQPSIRVSFPVTDRTGFRLSYAQQAQTPDFNFLATGANTDLANSNSNDYFARQLDYGKTILFEFGVRHAFSSDLVLDVSAYNKDQVAQNTIRIEPFFDPANAAPGNLNVTTNADFGNVRGIDLKLDARVGSLFQGSLGYTFENAKSTGSDPFEYILTISRATSNVTGDRTPPPQALLTTRDNRTHTIAGSLALNFPHAWRSGSTLGTVLQDVGAYMTFRFASGLVYTRMVQTGAGSTGPGNNFGLSGVPAEPLNASTMPWIKNIDLRLSKGLRIGGSREMTVFADFRNVLNFTNWTAVFAETGDIRNRVVESRQISTQQALLATDAGSLVRTRVITNPDGSATTVTGVDLSDCSAYLPGSTYGIPDCVMLRRAEARFGNGDQFFTTAEQTTAYTAWYDVRNGPYTLLGQGRNIRLGFEFNF